MSGYLPEDCSECTICGTPVLGWGKCDLCAEWPPRDEKGRFAAWPDPPMYPENGDRVQVNQWQKDGYEGPATVVNDYRDDEWMRGQGHMIVRLGDGTERDIHPGWMTVVERTRREAVNEPD